jgi:hypothetical protein
MGKPYHEKTGTATFDYVNVPKSPLNKFFNLFSRVARKIVNFF